MAKHFCQFLNIMKRFYWSSQPTQTWFVIFKLLHYNNLGRDLPESGVPYSDILISAIVSYNKRKSFSEKFYGLKQQKIRFLPSLAVWVNTATSVFENFTRWWKKVDTTFLISALVFCLCCFLRPTKQLCEQKKHPVRGVI